MSSDSRPPTPETPTRSSGSESENPAIDSPTPKAHAPLTNQDWWPEQIDVSVLHAQSAKANPFGDGLRLRRGVREARRRGAQGRRHLGDDALAGLVARRLRPLRRPVHPDELARRRHLPHLRRPRRRRPGRAALRPAQQLARQRQPGQGAPAAVADQEEVRQQDLLGRPAGLRRQRRAGVDGLQDLRLRASAARTSGSPRRSSSARRTTWLGTDKRYSGDAGAGQAVTAPPPWA